MILTLNSVSMLDARLSFLPCQRFLKILINLKMSLDYNESLDDNAGAQFSCLENELRGLSSYISMFYYKT